MPLFGNDEGHSFTIYRSINIKYRDFIHSVILTKKACNGLFLNISELATDRKHILNLFK